MTWERQAACVTADPEAFFPVGKESVWPTGDVNLAKSYCRRCEVRGDCLGYAIGSGQDHGIWGGLTPQERRELVREQSQRQLLRELKRERFGTGQGLGRELVRDLVEVSS